MSPHRQNYSAGLLPALKLPPASTEKPSWQPRTLDESQLNLPAEVADLIKHVRWDWIFDLSSNLAGQFRKLGMTGTGPLFSEPSSSLMIESPELFSPPAMAHAWVMSMVQRTAMEIHQMQLLDEPRQVNPKHIGEVTGIAFLATTTQPQATGQRLTQAMQRIATSMAERCDAFAVIPGASRVQFMHAKPVQLVSPVIERMAVPVAAYRVRYSDMPTRHLLDSLREALEETQSASDSPMESGDVLMLSNLWNDAGA